MASCGPVTIRATTPLETVGTGTRTRPEVEVAGAPCTHGPGHNDRRMTRFELGRVRRYVEHDSTSRNAVVVTNDEQEADAIDSMEYRDLEK